MSTETPWADDPEGAAGEYVLGTLPAEERAAFARALSADPALQASVAAWESRLAPLAAGPAIQPDPRVWAAIEARLDGGSSAQADPGARIIRLERGLRRWQLAAGTAAALAAGLALWIAIAPRLPVPAAESAPQYVAVVDRGGALPALLVRVDLGARTVQVRSLAAETPAGRSLELWYVAAGAAPRSLGLVADGGGRLPIPAALRGGDAEGASLAVSVEPPGGSPTGAPTGPVVYSGRLVRD